MFMQGNVYVMNKTRKLLLKLACAAVVCAAVVFVCYKLLFSGADVLVKEAYYEIEYDSAVYALDEDTFSELTSTAQSVVLNGESYKLSLRAGDGVLSVGYTDGGREASLDAAYTLKYRLRGIKNNTLTARFEDGSYYKLASVTAPSQYSVRKDAADLDGDPLTTQFAYKRNDTKTGTLNFTVYALLASEEELAAEGYTETQIGYPDDGTNKAKSKSGIKYDALYKTDGESTYYLLNSPYENAYICIRMDYTPNTAAVNAEALLEAHFANLADEWANGKGAQEVQAYLDAHVAEPDAQELLRQLLARLLASSAGKTVRDTQNPATAAALKQLKAEKAQELRALLTNEELDALKAQLAASSNDNEAGIALFNMVSGITTGKQLSSVAADFKQNFIDDSRWTYLLNGLLMTLLITVVSGTLGVLIGAIVAAIRTTWDKTNENMRPGIGKALLRGTDKLCGIYLTVIRGTPVMVQLLIMYLIIFASSSNGTVSAIIAFGINSGAYVAEIIRGGIMSIDQGQFEAGRSLGFGYLKTMLYIILPQVLRDVLPALANEFIALLKETSVSGYVAVKDLNKGGEIIRSVTYSPFMPLIAVALIYLAVVMFFTKLVSLLERRLRASGHR